MNFREMETEYRDLRRLQKIGLLTEERLRQSIARLNRESATEDWMLNPEDGSWLHFDGKAWVAATPPYGGEIPPPSEPPAPETPPTPAPEPPTTPAPEPPPTLEPVVDPTPEPKPPPPPEAKPPPTAAVKPPPPPEAKPPPPRAPSRPPRGGAGPQSLLQLFALLAKRFLKSLVWQIPLGIVAFVTVWVFHTYVLVVINEGFWPSGSAGWVQAQFARVWVNLNAIPLGNAITTFFVSIIDSILVMKGKGGILAPLVWMAGTSFGTGVVARVLMRGPAGFIGDVFGTPLWIRNSARQMGLGPVSKTVLFAGVGLGLVLSTALGSPSLGGSRMLAFLLGLHASTIVVWRLEALSVLTLRLGWSDATRILRLPLPAFRPIWALMGMLGLSGGLLGGSVLPWLLCCGSACTLFTVAAGIAVVLIPILGRKEGVSNATVVLMLGILGGLALLSTGAWADDGGWQESGGTFVDWVQSEGAFTAVTHGVGPSVGSWAGIAAGWMSALGSQAAAMWGGLGAWTAPTTAPLGGTAVPKDPIPPEVRTAKDWFTGLMGMDQTKNALDTIFSKVPGLDGYADDAVDAFKKMVSQNVELLEGGMTKIKNQTWYDDAIKTMVNSKASKKLVSWLDSGATVLGVAFDAVDNIVQGDAWYYGIGKASGAGALMAKIGAKNPGLAVMEFVNFVAFGGSKASDCISPTKNITGPFNMLVDKLVDWSTGSETAPGRIESGAYGTNVKNLGDAASIAGEYFGNPDEVGQELSDWVTDPQNIENAYDQSYELWKPPPDAWLPKKLACGAGELATDAVIKGVELTQKGAQMAGEAYEATAQAASALKSKIMSWF
ncbi:MAG: hypothetical protein JRI25_08315 [Deltaproteobacteria bacterium]|nr:hypothetical protein [Deltaproteobacteria bacterium]